MNELINVLEPFGVLKRACEDMEFITWPVYQKVSHTFVEIFKMKNTVYSSRNKMMKHDISAREHSIEMRRLSDLVFENRVLFTDKSYIRLMNTCKIK